MRRWFVGLIGAAVVLSGCSGDDDREGFTEAEIAAGGDKPMETVSATPQGRMTEAEIAEAAGRNWPREAPEGTVEFTMCGEADPDDSAPRFQVRFEVPEDFTTSHVVAELALWEGATRVDSYVARAADLGPGEGMLEDVLFGEGGESGELRCEVERALITPADRDIDDLEWELYS